MAGGPFSWPDPPFAPQGGVSARSHCPALTPPPAEAARELCAAENNDSLSKDVQTDFFFLNLKRKKNETQGAWLVSGSEQIPGPWLKHSLWMPLWVRWREAESKHRLQIFLPPGNRKGHGWHSPGSSQGAAGTLDLQHVWSKAGVALHKPVGPVGLL